ncbi:hypothetical protein EOA37_09530 [Mesorhizobium sp. M2A.F.Ca.ET.015.02.1.1]|uniref:hypothetical protein n=1 Tax=Mesorhizobium sp. M2A.F.Ca.ET.015.02.1.1 TaxID=2496758 RepID=UPI000FCC8A0C|nr:hypothetical protein [Mesorhizobium sp. M2A.F.Ca.ET.015.02.1.1]RUW41493.1 hypothetical protein EOA37_09530 [Mesorhizobium sp. M2A.F.Ca.ET.015.02.1.1]
MRKQSNRFSQHRPLEENIVVSSAALTELIIAARIVAYGDHVILPEHLRALDKAVDAFAELVPWDDDPNDVINLAGSGPVPIEPRNLNDTASSGLIPIFSTREG